MKSNITFACEQVNVRFDLLAWGELFDLHGQIHRKISNTHALNLNQMHPVQITEYRVTKIQRSMSWELPEFTCGGHCPFNLLPVGTCFVRAKGNAIVARHLFMKVSENEIMDTVTMKCNSNLGFDTVEVVECEPIEITIK